MYIYIYEYRYICMCMQVYVCICVDVCIYTCTHVLMTLRHVHRKSSLVKTPFPIPKTSSGSKNIAQVDWYWKVHLECIITDY